MTEAKARIRRLSRRLEITMLWAAAALGVFTLAGIAWAFSDSAALSGFVTGIYAGYIPGGLAPLSLLQTVLLAALFAVQALLLGMAFLALRAAFGEIARQEAISTAAAAHMRRAGRALFATALMMLAALPLNSLVLSIGRPQGFIAAELTSAHLMALLASALVLAFGHFIAAAAEIDAENREII